MVAHDRRVTPRGTALSLRERGHGRSAFLPALLALVVGGCVSVTTAPSGGPTSSAGRETASMPAATSVVPPEQSWPSKAPRGTPEPVPPGSLLPGEDNLALEAFDDPSVFGGPGRVTLRYAVALGSGFVVLGYVWHAVGVTTGQAWLSPDGRTWERVDVPAMDDAFVINDFAAAADGTLIAVGIGEPLAGAVVWTSFDGGRSWQTTRIEDAGKVQLRRVVAGPHGLVMLGSTGNTPARDGDTTLWWSPDGRRWTRAEMPRDVFGDVSIGAISATASGFVAVGGRWPAGEMSLTDALDRTRGAAWLSGDGLSWVETDVPEAPGLGGLVLGERTMLASGSRWNSTATSWWRSDDGRAWEPVVGRDDLGNPTESWTVFGWRGSFYRLGSSWSSGGPVLELWTSEDGDAWRRIGATLERRTGGIGGEVVPGEPGMLMRGERDGAGVLWLIPWPAP